MSFASALTTVILPVLAVAAVGYLLASIREVDIDPLATVTLYILAPALVFHSIATTTLGGEVMLTVVAAVGAFIVSMVVLSETVGRLSGEAEPVLGALVLSSTFSNSGNFGIPLSTFAFGQIGRSTAVLYLVAQTIFMYTIGVYLASRGSRANTLAAAKEIFRLPLLYALLAAVLVRLLGAVPPASSTVMRTVELTGNAAIPVMLVMVGVQLANTNPGAAIGRVAVANVLKLVVAPSVAIGIVLLIGFPDMTVARVFILESAMPAAVTPLMLSIEYRGTEVSDLSGPEYVSTAIFTSTLASVATLTILIGLLQTGLII